MKKYLILAALLMSPLLATAQVSSSSGSASDSASASQANNDNVVAPNQQAALQVNQNWEASQPLKNVHVKTNQAVPLAASVSFSSDYCGGTASGGLSGWGVSIGGGSPVFDPVCQLLRVGEKAGVTAANAAGAGDMTKAHALVNFQSWSVCHAASLIADKTVAAAALDACKQLKLVGTDPPPVAAAAQERERRSAAMTWRLGR